MWAWGSNLWVILVWVCEPVFSDQPQSESYIQKYPFIYLISQKVDPFINSPPPPKVNFIKSLIVFIGGGGYKTKKMGASIPLISESVGTLLLKF